MYQQLKYNSEPHKTTKIKEEKKPISVTSEEAHSSVIRELDKARHEYNEYRIKQDSKTDNSVSAGKLYVGA